MDDYEHLRESADGATPRRPPPRTGTLPVLTSDQEREIVDRYLRRMHLVTITEEAYYDHQPRMVIRPVDADRDRSTRWQHVDNLARLATVCVLVGGIGYVMALVLATAWCR